MALLLPSSSALSAFAVAAVLCNLGEASPTPSEPNSNAVQDRTVVLCGYRVGHFLAVSDDLHQPEAKEGGDRIIHFIPMIAIDQRTDVRTAFSVPWSTSYPLRNHRPVIQAGFGHLWSMHLGRAFYLRRDAGPSFTSINTVPGESLAAAVGKKLDYRAFESCRESAFQDRISKEYPNLASRVRASRAENLTQSAIYWDFVVTGLRKEVRDAEFLRAEAYVVLLPRGETKPSVLSLPYSSAHESRPIERFDVPFDEPFYLSTDASSTLFFVTESGKVFVAPKPEQGKPRQVTPLWDDPKAPVRVLLRDAQYGDAWVFTQPIDGAPAGKEVYFHLEPKPKIVPIKDGFGKGLTGQPKWKVVSQYAELLKR